jgi:ankyrin repeat protein
MKKIMSLFEDVAPAYLNHFKIVDENAFIHLKIFLQYAKLNDYERFLDWLRKNFAIIGQIETKDSLGIVFKTAEMSAKMGLYLLQSDLSIVKCNFNAIDLAKFIIKLHPFIDSRESGALFGKLKSSLLEMTNYELDKYRSLNKLALNLGMDQAPQALTSKLKKNNNFEDSYVMLEGIINLIINSTRFCCKLLDKIGESISDCNHIAHRAIVAVEMIQNINKDYSFELTRLLKECFDGKENVFSRMQSDSEVVLSHYLRKFKLPESLVRNCNESRAGILNSHRPAKKCVSDRLDYLSHRVVKINNFDIDELGSRVAQLNAVKIAAERILVNYNKFWLHVQKFPCVITELLPEKSDLISPMFHKYNSLCSPLTSAIVDTNLDQAANLKLFSDLAKTMPYQSRKKNVSIYGENGYYHAEFMSPLCHAVERELPEVVRIILENDGTVNPVDNQKAPLHRAMIRGNLKIVKLLLKFGARPDLVTNDEGYTALHYSADAECAAYLIDWVAKNSEKYPNISLPKFIDARDRYGNTSLHRICQKKVLNFSNISRNYNLPNADMRSQQHLSLMQILIDKKADVNAVNLQGHSALHFVLMICTAQKSDEVHLPTVISAVKILLDAGSNVNLVSREKSGSSAKNPTQLFTPLLAIFDPNYLGNINAFSNKKNRKLYLQRVTEMLVNRGASINIFDEELKTPLEKAILVGADSSVRFLLENGANPNLRANKQMPTPLHYCMTSTNVHTSANAEIRCLEHLLNAGASPQLLLVKSLNIKFENKRCIKSLTYAMRLILSQENEFSQYAKDLDMTDKEESIEERFIRVWTALDIKDLTICVQMNPLEYASSLSHSSSSPNPRAVAIFNEWLNFYRSNDVKVLLNVLCLDSQWAYIPNDLVILFAQHFSDNPMQVKLLQKWIFSGRQLLKTQAISKDKLSFNVLTRQNFFTQDNGQHIAQDLVMGSSLDI